MNGIVNIINHKVDLVDYIEQYTDLKRVGSVYKGACPIHGSEDGENIVVYPQTNTYYCFTCGSGGGVCNFLADYEHIPYTQAVEQLAHELNLDIGNNEEWEKTKALVSRFERQANTAHSKVDNIRDYLHNRGIDDNTIDVFNLGCNVDQGGSLIIPIRNGVGQTVALASRRFDKKPKYLNSRNNEMYDKSSLLYGLDVARKMIKDTLYLCEGYMDAISGYQMGVPTVAFCSNEIHKDQIRTLSSFIKQDITIVYCPDNDEAGKKKIERVRANFKQYLPKCQVRVLLMPEEAKDLNDLLKAGINVKDMGTEHIDKYVLKVLLERCEEIEQEYSIADEYLKTVSVPMIKLDIIHYLAERWDKSYDEVREYFNTPKEDIDDLTKDASGTEECILDLKRLYSKGEFKTGFQQLDNCIGGLVKKQVFIVGAYSSSGKTDFAIEYILRQISQNKSRVLFFSLEMPKGKVMERMVAKIVGVPLNKVRELVESDDVRIKKVIETLNNRLIVYDNNNLSMSDIDSRITAVNQKNLLGGPVDLVVLDYFTYLKGASTFEGASEQALMLKGIAKRHDIIFMVLSQISRKGNTYEEPTMDMLRMTGDLEASADVIVMMWRPEKQPNLSLEQKEKVQYLTRMKVEKARDGIYGTPHMEFKYNIENSRLEENFSKEI